MCSFHIIFGSFDGTLIKLIHIKLCQSGDKTINVKTRRGFLRLALRHGVDILPCFCFGETNMHDCYTPPGAGLLKRLFRIGLILPMGRFYREVGSLGITPLRVWSCPFPLNIKKQIPTRMVQKWALDGLSSPTV